MPWILYPQNHMKLDWSSGSWRVAFLNGHTVSNAHDTWSDVSADELSSGSGYTANGFSVTVSRTVTGWNVQTDLANFTASSFTGTANTLVLVKNILANGTLATTDPLGAYLQPNGGSSFTGIGDHTFGTTDDQGGGSESYLYDVDIPTS